MTFSQRNWLWPPPGGLGPTGLRSTDDIYFAEQPVPDLDINGLADVRRNSPLPIQAVNMMAFLMLRFVMGNAVRFWG